MPYRRSARPLLTQRVMNPRVSMTEEQRSKSIREWVWWAIALQALGYVIDIVWHALLGGGAEPATFDEMARHLITVHLLLYLGCASVLIATTVALIQGASESRVRSAVAIAFAGAVLSAAAEAWHAYSHLQLDTHHAPMAGILSAIGFVVVVVATWQAGRPSSLAQARARRGPVTRSAGRSSGSAR